MLGKTILEYTVDEKIGSGGFGTVYKVSKSDRVGTEIRALKHISIPSEKQYMDVLNSMGGNQQKADDYFAGVLDNVINEIKNIRSMSSGRAANIVAYYEHKIVEQRSPRKYDVYILMEYLKPLTDYTAENILTVEDVVRLAKDMLAALIACHSENIIHRDIKEDNIFVSSKGIFKLGDFGVSRVLKDRSGAESLKGTPNYIAPEVYLGKEKYDKTVDLYSLGIVLYRLLNMTRNPFLPSYPAAYTSEDEDVAFDKRMKYLIPELPCFAQNILGEAIVHALKPRGERYATAQEFLDAIVQAADSLTDDELKTPISQGIQKVTIEQTPPDLKTMQGETLGSDLPLNTGSEPKEIERNRFDDTDNASGNKPLINLPKDDYCDSLDEKPAKSKALKVIAIILGIVLLIVLVLWFVVPRNTIFGLTVRTDGLSCMLSWSSEEETDWQVQLLTKNDTILETINTANPACKISPIFPGEYKIIVQSNKSSRIVTAELNIEAEKEKGVIKEKTLYLTRYPMDYREDVTSRIYIVSKIQQDKPVSILPDTPEDEQLFGYALCFDASKQIEGAVVLYINDNIYWKTYSSTDVTDTIWVDITDLLCNAAEELTENNVATLQIFGDRYLYEKLSFNVEIK